MSACSMLSYNRVTLAVWQCCIGKAAQYGVQITSSTGQASQHGFTIAWTYREQEQTLSLQCVDSPFWAPCSTINGKINDAVEDCLNQHNIEMENMVVA
jgi:hypothetical protein